MAKHYQTGHPKKAAFAAVGLAAVLLIGAANTCSADNKKDLLSCVDVKDYEPTEDYAQRMIDCATDGSTYAMTVPTMQWISVKDRLPDEGGSYIVHSGASGKVFTAHYWTRDRRWSGRL